MKIDTRLEDALNQTPTIDGDALFKLIRSIKLEYSQEKIDDAVRQHYLKGLERNG